MKSKREPKFGAIFLGLYGLVVVGIVFAASNVTQKRLRAPAAYCEVTASQCEGHRHDRDPILASMDGSERMCPCADRWYCEGVLAAQSLAQTVTSSLSIR